MKHFSLSTGKGEDRQINNRDDQDTKEHWCADLFARVNYGVQSLFNRKPSAELMLFSAKLPDHIFNNYDRAVDDQPEINCTQAHQIPGDAEPRHSRDSKEKRERDRRRDNQRSAPV